MTYRILSLAGGGVRGVFQAIFLKSLAARLGEPLSRRFDLIAGTSTGALVGLAVAFDVELNELVTLYRQKSRDVFRKRALAAIRRGPRYSQTALRTELERLFEERSLAEAKTGVYVAATAIDKFGHQVFSTLPGATGGEMSVVDVALATSAAPTYFPAVQPDGSDRAFCDGGLWANSPTLAALLAAESALRLDRRRLRILSVGTGDFPAGSTSRRANRLRPLSVGAITTAFEMMFAAQADAADEIARGLVGRDNFLRVSTPLAEEIDLDDVSGALETLPALAEREAERRFDEVRTFLDEPASSGPRGPAAATVERALDAAVASAKSIVYGLYPNGVPLARIVERVYRARVHANGDAEVVEQYALVAESEPVTYFLEKFYCEDEAPGVAYLEEIGFEVSSAPPHRADYLVVDSSARKKRVAVFPLPAIILGESEPRRIELRFRWPGYFRRLLSTGSEDHSLGKQKQTMERFEAEILFASELGEPECSISRAVPGAKLEPFSDTNDWRGFRYTAADVAAGDLIFKLRIRPGSQPAQEG